MTEEIKFLEKFYRNIQNKIPGDYVACRVGRKGKPFVAQVNLDDFLPKLFGHSYFNVENIPLTEKILEKNGWRKNEEDSTHWEHPDVVFNIKSYGSEEHPLQVSVSGQIVPFKSILFFSGQKDLFFLRGSESFYYFEMVLTNEKKYFIPGKPEEVLPTLFNDFIIKD